MIVLLCSHNFSMKRVKKHCKSKCGQGVMCPCVTFCPEFTWVRIVWRVWLTWMVPWFFRRTTCFWSGYHACTEYVEYINEYTADLPGTNFSVQYQKAWWSLWFYFEFQNMWWNLRYLYAKYHESIHLIKFIWCESVVQEQRMESTLPLAYYKTFIQKHQKLKK